MISFDITDMGGALCDALEDAARKQALKIRTERVKKMKAVAPVKTGRYRDGITGEVRRTPHEITLEIGGKDRKTHWIEYGTSTMAPRPIITRGFDKIEEEYAAAIAEEAEKIKDLV